MGDSIRAGAEAEEDFENLCSTYDLRPVDVDDKLEVKLKKMQEAEWNLRKAHRAEAKRYIEARNKLSPEERKVLGV